MTFPELLIQAIQRSEIPLRFEPGAEESVAAPVTEVLRVWLTAHRPDSSRSEFDDGQKALIDQLLDELDGKRELPA